MKDIKDFVDFSKPAADVITALKQDSKTTQEDYLWEKLKKDYEPALHRIVNDHSGRSDKKRSNGTYDKASRIHLGLEKLLVNRMVEFMFAIPVKRIYKNVDGNETKQQIVNAIEAIYAKNHINTQNLDRAEGLFAACECVTFWYPVEKDNKYYGFESKFQLKSKSITPMAGYSIYPLFDEYDDLIALSFEYKKYIKDIEYTFFECYTADRHIKWKYEKDGWQEEQNEDNAIGKIPAIYIKRKAPLYEGLQHLREEIEYALSRNSDVVAYNSAPILKVSGDMTGNEKKGESQRIYRVENGGDVSYVSWAQSTAALQYHVETLLRMFFMQAQIPDISFENMRSLGNIGFDARQTLLTDTHLKVGDESGAFIEFFEREFNVIKAFLKEMNASWAKLLDELECEHIITPFIQNDEKAEIQKWMQASGGKAVCSQLEAIKYLGITDNAEETIAQINKEQDEAMERQASLAQRTMGGY